MFVTINNAGIKINLSVNVKNWLINVCDKGFIWNPSNCQCECDKFCDAGEYLDYSNCKCRKKLFDKLVEECTKSIDEIEIAGEKEHKNKCSSLTLYIVLFWIIFTISIGIAIYFV